MKYIFVGECSNLVETAAYPPECCRKRQTYAPEVVATSTGQLVGPTASSLTVIDFSVL